MCSFRMNFIMNSFRTRGSSRQYDTYIFQGGQYWYYENSKQRPATGYPRSVSRDWPRAFNNLDTYLHYHEFSPTTSAYIDEYFFFKGTQNWKFAFFILGHKKTELFDCRYFTFCCKLTAVHWVPTDLQPITKSLICDKSGWHDLLISTSDDSTTCRIYFFYSEFYTFSGSRYYQFDPVSNRMTSQGAIGNLFKSNIEWSIPNNLDAAFYENNTRTIFFFKGTKVK